MEAKYSADSKGSLCIVRHGYYPSELNVKREAEALLHAGYDVHVLCLRRNWEKPRETVGGIHVRRLPVEHQRGKISRYLFEYNAFFILASLELLRLHAHRQLRAVQINTMPDYLVFTTLLPRLLGTKIVLHMHEPMPELFETIFPDARYRPIIRSLCWVERLSLAYADSVINWCASTCHAVIGSKIAGSGLPVRASYQLRTRSSAWKWRARFQRNKVSVLGLSGR
jgi:hypothetical protein